MMWRSRKPQAGEDHFLAFYGWATVNMNISFARQDECAAMDGRHTPPFCSICDVRMIEGDETVMQDKKKST